MERLLRSSLVVLALLVLQTTFVPLLSIGGVQPDLLLIWLAYNSVRRGQVEGTIGGFLVGVLQDAATTHFFGLAALSKTLAGFVGGYFYNENKTYQTLGTYRFVVVVLTSSVVHNLLYFTLLFQGVDSSGPGTVFQWSLTTTFYTSALSVLPMFALSRKQVA